MHYTLRLQQPLKVLPLIALVLVTSPLFGTPLRLKVGTLPFISNSILAIAQSEGFFVEQGLDVELLPFANSNDFIPLLVKGELDVATPALTAGFFNAISRGGKLRMVLPLTDMMVQNLPTVAFLVRSGDGKNRINVNPASWKGRRIGLSPAGATSVTGFLLTRALKSAGLGMGDVNLVSLDINTQADALMSGQVDLLYSIEPWITRLCEHREISILLPIEPFYPEMVSSMIVYSRRLLENVEAGTRFATAYLKAVRQYLEGKTSRNIEIITKFTGLDSGMVVRMGWSHSPADGHIDVESLMSYQQWLKDQGLVDQVLDPSKFIDTRFTTAAARTAEMSR